MPSASSSPLRAAKFSIMPLWTTAKSPCSERCGWAFVSVGAPWVAQRVWAMPHFPVSAAPFEVFSARFATEPLAFTISMRPASSTATPALS